MSAENTVNSGAPAAEENANSKRWEDLETDKVRSEFNKMRDSLDALRTALDTLAKDKTNFDKTKDTLEKVRNQDFSSGGWISSFINENTDAFPGLNGDGSKKASKPDWYFMLMPEKRKKYDDILDYMDDAVKLKVFFKPFQEILMKLPLRDTFRVFAIIKNMNSKGWDTTEYQQINKDLDSVCSLLKLSWNDLSSMSGNQAERFYQEHVSQMDSPKMKEGYIKQRQEDYYRAFQKFEISKSFNYRGNGQYGVLAHRLASMKTLDAYMGKLVGSKDLDDRLKTLITDGDRLSNAVRSNIVLHTSGGKTLHQGMVNLIVTIQFYLTCGLEEFTKFKDGSNEAPYCFMKCPEAADRSPGYFGFQPKWGNSWDNGTGYYEIYRKALFAVMTQCHDFAYVHGRVR